MELWTPQERCDWRIYGYLLHSESSRLRCTDVFSRKAAAGAIADIECHRRSLNGDTSHPESCILLEDHNRLLDRVLLGIDASGSWCLGYRVDRTVPHGAAASPYSSAHISQNARRTVAGACRSLGANMALNLFAFLLYPRFSPSSNAFVVGVGACLPRQDCPEQSYIDRA